MATLKGIYKNFNTAPVSQEIGSITASATTAKGKIAEIIVANCTTGTVKDKNNNDVIKDIPITYNIDLVRPGENTTVAISPTTTLDAADVHVKPMSTFIQGGDELKITATGKVKTVVSIIEL